ncbi:MAG: DegQ family serine endoprotease [Nitrospira sp.]|nr:DegQ family serine endoprotease [Nitrospira sp.]
MFWAGDRGSNSHAANSVPPGSGSAAAAGVAPATSLAGPGFTEVAKAVTPAVVNITATRVARREGHDSMEEFFGFPFPGRPRGPLAPGEPRDPRDGHATGMGSGVIVSSNGYIVTNNHVVEGAHELTVTLPDKREFTGKVVGTDPKSDLAVIKVEAQHLPVVSWGDSGQLQVGEYVLAVGNPFGLTSTVTSGIVSALGRGHMGITQYEDFIQTDAAINPGNSGGALVNAAGELVGINTAIISQTGGYQGVGFAIPVSMAKPIYESLVATGKVVRGYLGVGIQDLNQDLAKSFDLKQPQGALVSDVNEDGPAEKGGLKQGDIIVKYQGGAIGDAAALQRAVTRTAVGAKAQLTVVRNGREVNLAVTIGEQPGPVTMAGAEKGLDHALAGLDVQGLDRQARQALGLDAKTTGVVVVNVEEGSAAGRAGIRPGDVIREINRQPVSSVKDYEKLAMSLGKQERALLLIHRRGGSRYISVQI